jgi:ribonuclease T
MKDRFRGYLPVVIDVETGGFNASTDAILELAGSIMRMDGNGDLAVHATHAYNVAPFEGANIEQSALDFTGIDPWHPFRDALSEAEVLADFFRIIRAEMKEQGCVRAILVGHNAHFDAGFLQAAVERCSIKRSPFHPFSYFDTATLSALAYGQTVLAKACQEAGVDFNTSEAHTADYDTRKTAELFCGIVNKWRHLGGWSPAPVAGDDESESVTGG